MKHKNPSRILVAYLNINSIRNKLESLAEITGKNNDLVLISETKIDASFPAGQFFINRYNSPFRKDRNDRGGGLLLYVRDHIPGRRLFLDFNPTIVLETGLSDFHKLTATVMKSTFRKQEPTIIHYRNYKHFNNDISNLSCLAHKLSALEIRAIRCSDFKSIFMSILNQLAPLKVRYIRTNNSSYTNKFLCKAVMLRFRLKNKFLKQISQTIVPLFFDILKDVSMKISTQIQSLTTINFGSK